MKRESLSAFVPSTSARIGARAIDGLIVLVFLAPALRGGPLSSLFEGGWLSWPFVIYLLLVPLLVETLAVWLFGTTPGKWVFGLHVVRADDDRHGPELLESFLRALAGKLSWFFSYAPQALMFYRHDRRHLADWIAHTRVTAEHPRERRANRRAILGSVLLVLFAVWGWRCAGLFVNGISIRAAGVSLNGFQSPGLEMAAKKVAMIRGLRRVWTR